MMSRSPKSSRYLNFDIAPRRRRWLRPVLVGTILVLLVVAGWLWSKALGAGPLARRVTALTTINPGTATAGTAPAAIRGAPPTAQPPSSTAAAGAAQVTPATSARTQVLTYTVQAGDTLWSIAAQFNLDVDTLRWSNPALERDPDVLSVGTQLVILPVVGAYHLVEQGETLSSIAERYHVTEAAIRDFPLNHLSQGEALAAGQPLMVPNGRHVVTLPTPRPPGDSRLAWPLVGTVTQPFARDHPGLDISAPYAAPVYASRSGTVIRTGWDATGTGYTLVIDHGGGLQTWYGHMKGEWVRRGERVVQGQLIGEVGSTGNSSGPHLHFEVHRNEQPVDPRGYLPAGEPR